MTKAEALYEEYGHDIRASWSENIAPLNNFQPPLQSTARGGQVETVRKLLATGTDPNVKSDDPKDYSSPLLDAVRGGHGEIVELLIFHGADVHQGVPLSTAAGEGNIKIMQMLITFGADVQAQDSDALAAAAFRGQFQAFQHLLDQGAKLPRSLKSQNELLWKAACGGSTPTIHVLFDRGIRHGFRTRPERSDDKEDP